MADHVTDLKPRVRKSLLGGPPKYLTRRGVKQSASTFGHDSKCRGELMDDQKLKEGTFKQKFIHELKTVGWVSLYLALFFCALCTYSMLMLHELNVTNSYFRYGFAIINALVIAKIILLGEYARLGRGHENKPLIISVLWKAFLFGLLVAAFHILEETIKRFALHQRISVDIDEMLIRNLVVFSFLVPFFAFWELRRVLGEGQLFDMFFRRRQQSNPDVSIGTQKA